MPNPQDQTPPKGPRVDFVAIGEARDDYGVLPAKGHAAVHQLRDQIRIDNSTARRIRDATGVLDRLRSFNLQVARCRDHEEKVRQQLLAMATEHPKDRVTAVHAADELSTDFESMLFHGRAALDRVSLFLAREHSQNSDRFSKLQRVLENASSQDHRPRTLLELLGKCVGLRGTMTDLEDEKALRSRVAHRSSITEGVQTHLTIHMWNGRCLVVDCEAFGRGVISTARALSYEIPYLVTNALRLYISGSKPISMSGFRVKEPFPVVVFQAALDPDEKGPTLEAYKLNKDGFTVQTSHIRPEILKLARRPR